MESKKPVVTRPKQQSSKPPTQTTPVRPPPRPAPAQDRLKTVIRRLPPNLPEDAFWNSVRPWVTDETTTWKVFHAGKLRKSLNKENLPSRAYIAFKTAEQLAYFSRDYDGHMFRDKQGNEYQAVVEFAPNQKVPLERRKPDPRHATIEQDEDYISFLDSLKNKTAETDPFVAPLPLAEQPKSTPLLEALKAEKEAATIKSRFHPATIAGEANRGGRDHEDPATFSRNPNKSSGSHTEQSSTKKGKRGKAPAPISVGPGSSPAAMASDNRQSAASPTPPSRATRQRKVDIPASDQPEGAANGNKPERERKRPLIGQNRHFEVALTAAGAVDSTSRGGKKEKKEKRDEEKGKETIISETEVSAPPAPPVRGGARGGKAKPPRGGGRGGASAGKPISSQPKIILARPDPLPSSTGPSQGPSAPSAPLPSAPTADAQPHHPSTPNENANRRGFPPRGRGRGRGRGEGRSRDAAQTAD